MASKGDRGREGARGWYAKRSPLAARVFLLSLESAVRSVAKSPAAWPEFMLGCRRYVFPNRYPFSLVYRETPDLQIVAVVHHSRRPGFWRSRKWPAT